ncbi:hypothetical protein SLIQ_17805 [Serratia liquefaciens FK01]|nr:hypothetical protein SLIQ_17805 [Serratia liquefaciens FK01]
MDNKPAREFAANYLAYVWLWDRLKKGFWDVKPQSGKIRIKTNRDTPGLYRLRPVIGRGAVADPKARNQGGG